MMIQTVDCKAVLNFLDVNNPAPGEDFTEPPFLKDFFRAARERKRQVSRSALQ